MNLLDGAINKPKISDFINIDDNDDIISPGNTKLEDRVTFGNKDIKNIFERLSIIRDRNICVNKTTSGGVVIDDLKEASSLIEYIDVNKTKGYCFDISDIARRFNDNNFINPFNNRPFSNDFVIQFRNKIRTIYSNSFKFDMDNIDIDRIKLKYILRNLGEDVGIVDKFYSLDSDGVVSFGIRNLGIDKRLIDNSKDKRDFIKEEWIKRLVSKMAYREKEKNDMSLLAMIN